MMAESPGSRSALGREPDGAATAGCGGDEATGGAAVVGATDTAESGGPDIVASAVCSTLESVGAATAVYGSATAAGSALPLAIGGLASLARRLAFAARG
jgi:hypothetical protein